jgi:hypothetical protein
MQGLEDFRGAVSVCPRARSVAAVWAGGSLEIVGWGNVLVEPSIRDEAKRWIAEHRETIIDQALAEQADEEDLNA